MSIGLAIYVLAVAVAVTGWLLFVALTALAAEVKQLRNFSGSGIAQFSRASIYTPVVVQGH